MQANEDFSDSLELLERARAGDDAALGDLLSRYRPRLLRRIRLMMGEGARQAAESEDFLQGLFVEVIGGLDGFRVRDERSFLRWATAIARNNIRDDVRRVRERALESLSESFLGEPSSSASPPSQADLRDKLERTAEALEGLSPEHRTALELHALEGLSFEELAERLGTSKSTARRLYHHALLELGKELRSAG